MTITTPHTLVGQAVPHALLSLLVPSPVTAADPAEHRAGVRLTPGRSGAYAEQVGHIQRLAHQIGLGGRMWDDATGNEADFAVVSPPPIAGRVYLTFDPDNPGAYAYVERRDDGTFQAFGSAEIENDEARFRDFGAIPFPNVTPTFWVEAKDPRVAEPEVTTPPAVVLPHWARLVKPAGPRPGYRPYTAYILSSPQVRGHESRPELAGTFRRIGSTPVTVDGQTYSLDQDTGAPVVGALTDTGHYTGSHHLWWTSRAAMEAGEEPVIVHLTDYYVFEVVADSHGRTVAEPHRVPQAGFTMPSLWTPPPGVRLDTGALATLTREFEHLWENWSEAMNEAAQTHDWCGDYERSVRPLGFPGREAVAKDWVVEINVNATVTLESPSGRLDSALSRDAGVDVVADEVVASVSLTINPTVSDVVRDEVEEYIDSSFVENYLEENFSGSWEVTDYSVNDIEEAF